MRDIRKIWSIRLAAGALLGAILTTLLAWLLLSFGVSNGQSIPVSREKSWSCSPWSIGGPLSSVSPCY